MATFRVWAPTAGSTQVEVVGRRIDMVKAAERGWWEVDVPEAAAGTDYRMSVDGDEPLPDPRSPWQPDGVHGPSRLVDHDAFEWTDAGWKGVDFTTAVLYEVHIGTFTPVGTFDAAIDRLGYLVDLGVGAVEVMPVAQFSGTRGWGYDGVDLYAPHIAYGGPEGMKRFVDACHRHGLGVVLDVVYNHLGPEGAYVARFGPYFTSDHVTDWGDALNVDGPHSDGVRQFVVDNALMWLRDYHCDALRLDAVDAIKDDSALPILEELTGAVSRLSQEVGRPLWVAAESDRNDPGIVRPPGLGGWGVDAVWADEFHHALHTVLTGERSGYYVAFGSMAMLAKVMRQGWVYDGTWSPYRRRTYGRPPDGLAGHQFVVALQNHDQVGNRACGERITALTSIDRAKVGAALLFTSPFVPLVFQGEEWAASTPFQYFSDHQDPALGRAVTEGRRREFADFGWVPDDVPDPQDPATFARSELDWTERERDPHAGMLEWYRALIALRRRLPALGTAGREQVCTRFSESPAWLVVERGPVTVVANLSEAPASIDLTPGRPTSVLLANRDEIDVTATSATLPPDSVVIVGD
jgi:maltooligosyltrehalose trehalohydrolase